MEKNPELLVYVRDILNKKKDRQIGKASEPPHLRMLIHGGTGVEKLFVVDPLIQIARSINYEVICTALTGIAASLLLDGDACHQTTSPSSGRRYTT